MTDTRTYLDGKVTLYCGDSRERIAEMAEASIDSIVCDPPYGLDFMGRAWDSLDGAPFAVEFWRECLRVLKPGGHLLAFGGTRTYHRLACAIEDAGFEIRDCIMWVYGSGFPKSLDVSKAIDKAAGAEREVTGVKPGHEQFANRKTRGHIDFKNGTDGFDRPWMHDEEARARYHMATAPATDAAKQWEGWGTALKPAVEPIVMARKPLIGTVAQNVLTHGTGAINIDGCRIGVSDGDDIHAKNRHTTGGFGHAGAAVYGTSSGAPAYDPAKGRFPANLIHDGSEEVLAGFPVSSVTGVRSEQSRDATVEGTAWLSSNHKSTEYGGDSGSAARFFYTAKADAEDRIGSKHPTVKPVDLMQWLVRLVTPKGGVVLDPFAGTGTTGEAAWREHMRAILIEREPEYQADIDRRMDLIMKPTVRAAVAKTKNKSKGFDDLPLFAGE